MTQPDHMQEGFVEGFMDYADRAGVPADMTDSLLKLSCALESAVDADAFKEGFEGGVGGLFRR